jgi:hypothetical protein
MIAVKAADLIYGRAPLASVNVEALTAKIAFSSVI